MNNVLFRIIKGTSHVLVHKILFLILSLKVFEKDMPHT